MAKRFALLVSIIFIASGLAAIFVPAFSVPIPQIILHFGAGLTGLLAVKKDYAGFGKWLGAAALTLAALSFTGISGLGNIFTFPLFYKWFYLIIGLFAVWVYLTLKFNKTQINI